MKWNLIGYWVIALPLGCWLGFVLQWGAVGFWDALCLALMLIGVGLLVKWYLMTKFWKNT
jgi:MATE family multidrug resistance protein